MRKSDKLRDLKLDDNNGDATTTTTATTTATRQDGLGLGMRETRVGARDADAL
jgi:hypothetical protein